MPVQEHDKIYIDGAWVPSTGTASIDVFDSTNGPVVHLPFADPYCPRGRTAVLEAQESSPLRVVDGGGLTEDHLDGCRALLRRRDQRRHHLHLADRVGLLADRRERVALGDQHGLVVAGDHGVHDQLEQSPGTAKSVAGVGWMTVLSGLKTLLETGEPLQP